ncbi:uncharacterized protein LOC122503091 [Leptopilina heterotoma]|uniref:uncharacterized protein LOC122503091 n=1 Tax=Leptopilina heterotoma TaxID=63436 RepID=UPI001CA98A27|nr:uncharacterized protein LOC122503091 [Leptopilina heterotoma]
MQRCNAWKKQSVYVEQKTVRKCKKYFKKCKNRCEKNLSDYHYLKNYDILQIGEESSVIVKQKNPTDNIVYMVPFEDYFPKLLEAHTSTGHEERDKMLYFIKMAKEHFISQDYQSNAI